MLGHPEANSNPVEKENHYLVYFALFFNDCDRPCILILTYPSAITGGKVFYSVRRYIVD